MNATEAPGVVAGRVVSGRWQRLLGLIGEPTPGRDTFPAPVECASVAAIAGVALVVRLSYGSHIRDDAFVTIRYAQHIASGLGFTFNSGQHVLGTTTPLFTLILAGMIWLGVPAAVGAVAVGVVCDVSATVLLWLFGRNVAGQRAAIFASLLYALMSPLVAYAVSGMETPLYLMLILLAFWAAYGRRRLTTAALCGLLTLLRPDGVIVPASLVLSAIWVAARNGTFRVRAQRVMPLLLRGVGSYWQVIVVFATITLPWLTFSWWYFGSPVPQSMLAKWNLQGTSPYTSIGYFLTYFLDLKDRWFLPLSLLALTNIVLDLQKRIVISPFYVWGLLYAVAFLLSDKFVYPLWPFEWYFLPLLVPLALEAGAGVARLTAPFGAIKGTALPAVIILVLGLIHLRQYLPILDRDVAGREALYLDMGAMLGRFGATNSTVAAAEIGALGYVHNGPILDLLGLVTPNTVGKSTMESLRLYRPQWLVSWDTDDSRERDTSSWFNAHYRPIKELGNWESRRLILYRWYPDPTAVRAVAPTLGATFALVGRTTSWQVTAAGAILHVELSWKALRTPSNPVSFSLQIQNAGGAKVAQEDTTPQEGTRPVTTWRQGDLVLDRYDLFVPSGDNPATLVIQGYEFGNPADALTWRSAANLAVGPRLYVPLPPGWPSATSADFVTCTAGFVAGPQLAAYRYLSASGSGVLTLRWRDTRVIDADYTVFVHVLDAHGAMIAQADGIPAGGRLPTSTWFPGDEIDDARTFQLTSAPSAVEVGLYSSSTGTRVPRADAPNDDVSLAIGSPPGCR